VNAVEQKAQHALDWCGLAHDIRGGDGFSEVKSRDLTPAETRVLDAAHSYLLFYFLKRGPAGGETKRKSKKTKAKTACRKKK
jgi:hypothetical protein